MERSRCERRTPRGAASITLLGSRRRESGRCRSVVERVGARSLRGGGAVRVDGGRELVRVQGRGRLVTTNPSPQRPRPAANAAHLLNRGAANRPRSVRERTLRHRAYDALGDVQERGPAAFVAPSAPLSSLWSSAEEQPSSALRSFSRRSAASSCSAVVRLLDEHEHAVGGGLYVALALRVAARCRSPTAVQPQLRRHEHAEQRLHGARGCRSSRPRCASRPSRPRRRRPTPRASGPRRERAWGH